jgi:bacterioferritin-associated ferredoxin
VYICICKAVTDGQIREAINQGACTRKQLIECLSVGRDCGKCNADVRELLTNHAPPINTPVKRTHADIPLAADSAGRSASA